MYVHASVMPEIDLLATFVSRLTKAASFEDAGAATLKAMLARAEPGLAAGSRASEARVLRGVIHLRPAGSYQRLFGIEHPAGKPIEGAGDLVSATVWRHVLEEGRAISIDVPRGTLCAWSAAVPGETRPWRKEASPPGPATRDRMMARSTTHVHVVPLRAAAGRIDGLISLEASCQAAPAPGSLWADSHRALVLIADIAAPHLCSLQPRPYGAVETDALLPVVGPSMAGLVELLRVFARQEETILLRGPTGAGKSRVARWCHEQSSRRGHRFETIHLLGVPEELQSAELFGWRRGAFTGAVRDNPGALARAARGTLFLDEIDKLSMKTQASLLHVLEERVYRPLGDESAEHRANVRFIVSTNADLEAAVRAGRFREDLYYRINVLPVRWPPLAERRDELPLWIGHMLHRRALESGAGESAGIASEAMKLLELAPWPGNLRQLDNIVRRAYALALADRAAAAGPVTLLPRHVERALAHDGSADPRELVTHLWRAARAFLDEADRRSESGSRMSLDLCDALRGMVLGAAVQRWGSREQAYRLLGQEALLRNRNHHRAFRRELDRVRELLALLGGEVDGALASMLAESSERASHDPGHGQG